MKLYFICVLTCLTICWATFSDQPDKLQVLASTESCNETVSITPSRSLASASKNKELNCKKEKTSSSKAFDSNDFNLKILSNFSFWFF
jgi:hypothetical protein